jgi:L-aminopeptidase/D-esterase-like protein
VSEPGATGPFESTTIGVVATNATLDKTACLTVAQGGHDGIARAIDPPHTAFDGDAVVALSVPVEPVEASVERVRAMAVRAFAAAIRAAVTLGAGPDDRH